MYRHQLSPRLFLVVVILIAILWLDRCDDLSWLPGVPFRYDS